MNRPKHLEVICFSLTPSSGRNGSVESYALFSAPVSLSSTFKTTSLLHLISLDTVAFLIILDSISKLKEKEFVVMLFMSDYIYVTNWLEPPDVIDSNYPHVLLLMHRWWKNSYQLCSISFSSSLLPLSFVSFGGHCSGRSGQEFFICNNTVYTLWTLCWWPAFYNLYSPSIFVHGEKHLLYVF